MNDSESEFAQVAESKGYTLRRNGWPDFALMRADGSLICVEVKTPGDSLSQEQHDMIEFLSLAGIPCYISRNGDFPDFRKPVFKIDREFTKSSKSCRLCELNSERLRYSVEREYHSRLERVEQILQQIMRLCDE